MAIGNEVSIVGNITSDIDHRVTPSGKDVARFSVAWNRRNGQDGTEEAHFFDVTCWNELAVNVVESCAKGTRVMILGRLDHQRWEDKQSGDKRSKVAVVADEVGPSLRWAEATITKTGGGDGGGRGGSRDGGGRQSRDYDDNRGGGGGSAEGRGRGRSYEDEEPF